MFFPPLLGPLVGRKRLLVCMTLYHALFFLSNEKGSVYRASGSLVAFHFPFPSSLPSHPSLLALFPFLLSPSFLSPSLSRSPSSFLPQFPPSTPSLLPCLPAYLPILLERQDSHTLPPKSPMAVHGEGKHTLALLARCLPLLPCQSLQNLSITTDGLANHGFLKR